MRAHHLYLALLIAGPLLGACATAQPERPNPNATQVEVLAPEPVLAPESRAPADSTE